MSQTSPLWYYGDSPISRAKGVTIVFSKEIRFILEERRTNPEGRYLFLRGKLNGAEVSIQFQHQLVDVWRIQHNKQRDYTFHSLVHETYSRLDFFLNEHRLLEVVSSTEIGIVTFSDHVPVTLQLKIGETQYKSNS